MRKGRKILLGVGSLCVAAMAGIVWYVNRPTAAQQQVAFITDFYQRYFAMTDRQRYFTPGDGEFFARQTDDLLSDNATWCADRLREAHDCGYLSGHDIFLNDGRYRGAIDAPGLHFRAVPSGTNQVDVSFHVDPEPGKDDRRTIRYVFVPQGDGWRVDDMLFGEKGRFTPKHALRYAVGAENAAILARASDLHQVVRQVIAHLGPTNLPPQVDTLQSTERFLADPVQVCGVDGHCESLRTMVGDVKLHRTLEILRQAYRVDETGTVQDLSAFLPRDEPVAHDRPIQIGAFEFAFRQGAWWITKIDLGRLARPGFAGLGAAPHRPRPADGVG